MCEKLFYCNRKIDSCLIDAIRDLTNEGYNPISSCCGHGKYHPTIVIKRKNNSVWDWFSGKELHKYNPKFDKRHNKYYQKDKDGIYFIPEVVN